VALAIVGLGSNLGSREAWIRVAIGRLAGQDGIALRSTSRPYLTAPLGPPQPDFLNAAIAISTELSPRALLERLLSTERDLGRERAERWGPRTIDLDLLAYEGATIEEDGLEVPHPRLLERAFALAPLLDVAPNLSPAYGAALARLGGAPPARAWSRTRARGSQISVEGLDDADALALALGAAWGGAPTGTLREVSATDPQGFADAGRGAGAATVIAWEGGAIRGLALGHGLGPPRGRLEVSVEGARALVRWDP
jgi:2-amino-4-hydroxy-6-hydroxymethyldihydropteridine diphosphokinase